MQTKKIPFNQYQAPKPKQTSQGRWYRRHIVLDHRHKEIQIQIMWDGFGELRQSEYHEIKKGAWFGLVPKEHISEYRKAIESGYKVVPIVIAGAHLEEHVLMQIIDITDDYHVAKDSTLNALHDEDTPTHF